MRSNHEVGSVMAAILISAVAMLGGTASAEAAPASPASVPRSVQAVAGNRSATVSWKAPASSSSEGVDRYRVTSRPGSRHCTTTGPTTCTVRGLANGDRYTFTVVAQDAADWGRPSSPSPAIVPGVPVDHHLLYPGADLAGADLRGANLQHVEIEGADLQGANLSGTNLAHADLLGVDLSGGRLTGAVLTSADLAYANLYDATLTGTDLTNADLSGATMTGVISGGITTEPAQFPLEFNLVDGYLAGPGADLSGVDLAGADLAGVDLSKIDLAGADLSGADLSGADLINADLSSADLVKADLSHGDLLAAGLTHANFSYADLRGTFCISSTATDADFNGAILAGAILAGADLDGVDFTNADLEGAKLTGANLTGVVSGGIRGTPTSLPSGWTAVNGALVPPS